MNKKLRVFAVKGGNNTHLQKNMQEKTPAGTGRTRLY
jgi:hypothetical protein